MGKLWGLAKKKIGKMTPEVKLFDVSPTFFKKFLFLRPGLFFRRQEQPKRAPKPQGFPGCFRSCTSVLAMVLELWSHSAVLGGAGVLVLFGAHGPPTRRRSWFMPRGTTRAQLATYAAILPTLKPCPSIGPGGTHMGDTPPILGVSMSDHEPQKRSV